MRESLARKEPPRSPSELEDRGGEKIPAMTDFRAKGTIMGPTGLTAVFGMGTGVTPPVSSPEIRPAGGQAAPGGCLPEQVGDRSRGRDNRRGSVRGSSNLPADPHGRGIVCPRRLRGRSPRWGRSLFLGSSPRSRRDALGRSGRIGVVKRSAVGTGPLRRSPAVHSQPIDLVVFQEPSQLTLPETSS